MLQALASTYLSFSEHTHVGRGVGGVRIVAVGDDGSIEEREVFTGRMVKFHLRRKYNGVLGYNS